MRVVAYVPDLMDRSRLAGPVSAAGASLRHVASPAELAAAAAGADLLLVDLGRPGVLEAVTALPEAVRVVGFASHVDAATLAGARQAGAEALARSAFFGRLAALLAG